MKTETTMEKMLRWRLEQAGREAPPAPRAARLLALARPWWETLPDRAAQLCARVGRIEMAYGHAMEHGGGRNAGYPVPVLLVRGAKEVEAAARLLYFTARDGELRLRFCLELPPEAADALPDNTWEVTFVSNEGTPLFVAIAELSVEREYRIEAALPPALAEAWAGLKVTNRMPFRFILGAVPGKE